MESNEIAPKSEPAIDEIAAAKRAKALADEMSRVRAEAELLERSGIDVHLHMFTDITVEADTLQVGSEDFRLKMRCDSRDENSWKAKLVAGPAMLYESIKSRFLE